MKSTGVGIVGAVLLAAGTSSRMDGVDKVWIQLKGRPLLAWALERLSEVSEIETFVIVAHQKHHETVKELARTIGLTVLCVVGGERRRDSVAAGLAALPNADWVLIHDAARPLANKALAKRVLAAARETGAAVPGLPVYDTIKVVNDEGLVLETSERSSLRAIQTPQVFSADLLRRAHKEVEGDASDDAWLVEQLGATVRVVKGEPAALKVTTAEDLERIRALAGGLEDTH
jgi:2-C-methyl-D-erythritol 4-phosphate cytidylyltransferase